jgi:uncharacterized damage-inducible protein DinB
MPPDFATAEMHMRDLLLRLVAHMRWADALVAESLVDDVASDPGVARLFAHLASAEHLWYARIQGVPPVHDVWPSLSPTESRSLAATHADLFERLLMTSDDAQLARSVSYRNSAGRDFQNSVGDIIAHTAMHGEHHRGQIARSLRLAGREPPYTDYIQFARRDQ